MSFELALHSWKETDNKLRWDTKVGKATFSLYIHKWRVPEPPPDRITVSIVVPTAGATIETPDKESVTEDPALRTQPIKAIINYISDHSRVTRYTGAFDCGLGQPYIPHELTHGGHEQLLITVDWDLATRGNFRSFG